jgi:hypothetical protein
MVLRRDCAKEEPIWNTFLEETQICANALISVMTPTIRVNAVVTNRTSAAIIIRAALMIHAIRI